MRRSRKGAEEPEESYVDSDGNFTDKNFRLNAKGYIEFNPDLIIASRYQLQEEIILDESTGTTAKGRYGSVFRVKDLENDRILALKINRIPPEEEDAKRQAAKDYLKQQQTQSTPSNEKNHDDQHNNHNATNPPNHYHPPPSNNHNNHRRRRVKTVKERYKSSCKREIGVLKRVSRNNQGELIPCLVLYDHGEYLGHTYMIFPVYDMTLQQHLVNVQKYQDTVQKTQADDLPNPPNTAPNNALIHPNDLWAFEEQLISALSYIHNVCHVMHLDFKPKNIMINTYAYDIQKYAKNLHLVKLKKSAITLIDFSVSAKAPRKANLDEVRYTGNFGTRRYRPPEMIYGGKWNRSVDTYGTAMIILECIKLFPIIDTTYYKRKKILKYKKKIKKAHQLTEANKNHHDRMHAKRDKLNAQKQKQNGIKMGKGMSHSKKELNGMSPPPQPTQLGSGYKQLDISEVLYLIMQQIGFPAKEYWTNLSASERQLFPRHPLIENVRRKGKRSKLFDNDGVDTSKHERKMNEMQMNGKYRDDEDDSDCSDDQDEEEFMPWNSFSDQLKGFRGIAWNLFKHYGSNLIETMHLDKMEESLRRMVLWDPRLRITPEQCLEEYFPNSIGFDQLISDEVNEDF